MNENNAVSLNANHILAAIGFEAKRISAVVDFYASGGLFPKPDELLAAIGRMHNMAAALAQSGAGASPVEGGTELNGRSAMKAVLS